MRRMTQLFFLLCLLIAGPARADLEAPDAADAAAIRDVIEAQLKAFQADDGAQAFSYASPAIQSIFKDPDTFMSMVRAGYQPVYRPREVEFRDLVPVHNDFNADLCAFGPAVLLAHLAPQLVPADRARFAANQCSPA